VEAARRLAGRRADLCWTPRRSAAWRAEALPGRREDAWQEGAMRGEQMAVEGKEPPRDTRRPRGLTSAERDGGGTRAAGEGASEI